MRRLKPLYHSIVLQEIDQSWNDFSILKFPVDICVERISSITLYRNYHQALGGYVISLALM